MIERDEQLLRRMLPPHLHPQGGLQKMVHFGLPCVQQDGQDYADPLVELGRGLIFAHAPLNTSSEDGLKEALQNCYSEMT